MQVVFAEYMPVYIQIKSFLNMLLFAVFLLYFLYKGRVARLYTCKESAIIFGFISFIHLILIIMYIINTPQNKYFLNLLFVLFSLYKYLSIIVVIKNIPKAVSIIQVLYKKLLLLILMLSLLLKFAVYTKFKMIIILKNINPKKYISLFIYYPH